MSNCILGYLIALGKALIQRRSWEKEERPEHSQLEWGGHGSLGTSVILFQNLSYLDVPLDECL